MYHDLKRQYLEAIRTRYRASKVFLAAYAYGDAKVFFVNFKNGLSKVFDPRRLMVQIAELSIE